MHVSAIHTLRSPPPKNRRRADDHSPAKASFSKNAMEPPERGAPLTAGARGAPPMGGGPVGPTLRGSERLPWESCERAAAEGGVLGDVGLGSIA
ncbi:uncharacterized protein N7482_001238 [Penicillium canariense]|uniref:Uncharacterized protein n=1 Tax=Penicillium canariense TaxID=189055 RepID=A0A9W9IJE0_9EURO|nr:uncharacterized protein N7482_001238 [Penicillium canariense]KAJ5175361.1 hypothetical protein N7482_001238 [Penicillium canariense]